MPEVLFLAEPSDLELQFEEETGAPGFPASRWTDAYLAAFAHGAGCRIVSFDGDFERFSSVEFLHLRPTENP